MIEWSRWAMRLLLWVQDTFFRAPLFRLYMSAPSYMDWGGWSDAPGSEICARLSGASAEFWSINSDECSRMVHHRFEAYFTTLELMVYFLLMAALATWVLCCCTFYASAWCYFRRLRGSYRSCPDYVPSPLRRRRHVRPLLVDSEGLTPQAPPAYD